MGIFDAGFALFEYTNQRIWDFYDVIVSTPAIVKIFQNNQKRKLNRRREKPTVGSLPRAKASPITKQHTKFRLRDVDTTSSPHTTHTAKTPLPPPPPSTAATPTTAEAPEKIKKLESELSKLRDEINKLMSNTKPAGGSSNGLSLPPPPPPMAMAGTCGTVSFPAQPVVPPSFVPTNAPPMSIPAPPAPPPPPAPGTPSKRAPVERVVTKRQVQQRGTMSLAEVLKGASSTNLRKTEVSRSPGGTPLDTPKNKALRPVDPQEIIAAALKKKFQSLRKLNSDTPESVSKKGKDGWESEEEEDVFVASPQPKRGKYSPYRDENRPPMENIDPASPVF